MIKNIISMLFVTLCLIVSCATKPKITELSDTADPQVEIERVSTNINNSESRQVNVLSPRNFASAVKYKDEAVKARSKNKKQKYVLHQVAMSQGYLDQANTIANVAGQILKGPIEARRDALAAQATKFFPSEMSDIDDDFEDLTEEVEDNNTSVSEKERSELTVRYRDLELKSIRKDHLGAAEATIKNAKDEGAEKLTPDTLVWAEKVYADSEARLVAQRHNKSVLQSAHTDATNASNRLLRMVRLAKGSTAMNPEDFAKQSEGKDEALLQSEEALLQSEEGRSDTQGKLISASARNEVLESEALLDKRYESARKQFNGNEAEVYKQGGTLLLRLKGLSFANNRATIDSANFPLMAKVQKVIAEASPSHIEIQGHTDSVGGKKSNETLSIKRAEAVEAYLIANKNVDEDDIVVVGLGDTKPISTNKTPLGRSQNRRVDVLITSN